MAIPGHDDLRDELTALLRWYGEMGVDMAVDAEPHDRFAETASPRREATAPLPVVVPQPPVAARLPPRVGALSPPPRNADPGMLLDADAAVTAARDAAAGAASLDALRDLLDNFEGCGLKRMATRLVFADGNPTARIMLVGEAPGAEEDRSGVPFVGRGGQLLDKMLGAVGLDRTSVYIANVVPWRPPGNRDPTPQEVAVCLPFIRRQIALCDPDIVLLMGKAALHALTGTKDGIMRVRGRWLDLDTGVRTVRAMAMLHPAYLLRQPLQKKFAWRDWRALKRALDETVR